MNQHRLPLLAAIALLLSPPLVAPAIAHASVLSPEVQVLTPVSTARQFAGTSVAIDGDLALVGVPGAANGASGRVVAYRRTGGVWMIVEEIPHPLAGATEAFTANFGAAVAIDGERAVIGAPNHGTGATAGRGAAYVYDWSGSGWVHDAAALVRPTTTPPRFGASVAISGERIAVGAPGTAEGVAVGAVVVFETPSSDGVSIPAVSSVEAGDDLFGASIALAGTSLVIGAPGIDAPEIDAGAAYAFDLVADVWTPRGSLSFDTVRSADAGTDVAVSADGLVIAVGAPGHGAATDENSGGVFVVARASTDVAFVSTSARLLVSEEPAPSTYFGSSVAIDGPRLLVGAPLVGASPSTFGRAYLFEDRDDEWVATARFALAEDTRITNQARLGDAVALSGDTALVAAPNDDGTSMRVGLVGVFLVPGVTGAGCSIDERCESNSCGESAVCCERDCGECGTCDASGMCMNVTDGESCMSACGGGMCSAGECVATCDAGVPRSDVDLVRIRVSGCACSAGRTNGRGGLLIGLAVGLALWRRRRSKS
jgi:MYXO-CTERM domain-containing protein